MSVNDYDSEFYEQIKDLVEEGSLEEGSTAYGVAQQVLGKGYDSLSPKQKYVYDNEFAPLLMKRQEEIRVIQILNSNPE